MNSKQIRPYIPHKVLINSTLSYRSFFKKYPKTVHNGEIKFFQSSLGNQTRTKMITRKLLKIAKRSRQMQGLYLHKSVLFHHPQADPQFKSIIKRFLHLRSLSVYLNGVSAASELMIVNYTKWLKMAKRIKDYYFIFRKYASLAFTEKLKHHFRIFLKTLRKKKLSSLRILLRSNFQDFLQQFLKFENYPTTLRKLGLSWKPFESVLLTNSLNLQETSLSHLKSLDTLNLNLPISQNFMDKILATLQNPLALKSFAAEPYSNDSTQYHEETTRAVLERQEKLESVNLKFNTWLDVAKILNGNSSISELSLELSILRPIHIFSLGIIVSQFKHLEKLTLRIRGSCSLKQTDDYVFSSFFKQIQLLSKLQKLKIYFHCQFRPHPHTKCLDFISLLKDSLLNLPKLEELSFRFHQINSLEGWINFFGILPKAVPQLRKLRMDFAGQNLGSQGFKALVDPLEKMKHLETFVLNNFWFDSSQDIKTLGDCLERLPHLSNLKLYLVNGEIDKTIFADFLRKILIKTEFRKFYCTQNFPSQALLDKEMNYHDRLNLPKILKEKNPNLQIAYCPFDIYSSSNDVKFCNWT